MTSEEAEIAADIGAARYRVSNTRGASSIIRQVLQRFCRISPMRVHGEIVILAAVACGQAATL